MSNAGRSIVVPPPDTSGARPFRLPIFVTPPPRIEPSPSSASEHVGDPFSPHKILNHIDRLQRVAAGEMVYPITVEIDPTNKCNHTCQWCVSAQSHTGELMDIDRFTRLIVELKAADVRSVVLKGGGEPTTHPHFLDMLDVLRDSGMAAGLITNGSMPRKGSVDKIIKTCQWVRVSLDAATAATHQSIHGSRDFARIIVNIEELAAAGTSTTVGLNFVAEQRNHAEMASFASLGKSLGAAYVTIRCVFDPTQPMSPAMRDAMRANAIAAKLQETQSFRVFLGSFTDRYLSADAHAPFPYAKCMGPNLIGIIGGEGEVYACCFLRGNKSFSFGNINEQSFAEIWSSDRRAQVMNSVYRGECGRVCAGGMTANRYNTYNEILNYLASEDKPHGEFA